MVVQKKLKFNENVDAFVDLTATLGDYSFQTTPGYGIPKDTGGSLSSSSCAS